jgi:hypothetical protein
MPHAALAGPDRVQGGEGSRVDSPSDDQNPTKHDFRTNATPRYRWDGGGDPVVFAGFCFGFFFCGSIRFSQQQVPRQDRTALPRRRNVDWR